MKHLVAQSLGLGMGKFRRSVTGVAFGGLASSGSSFVIILLMTIHLSVETWGATAAIWGVGQFLGSCINFGTSTERVRALSEMSDGGASRAFSIAGSSRLLISLTVLVGGVLLFALGLDYLGLVLCAASGVAASLFASVWSIGRSRAAESMLALSGDRIILLALLGVVVVSGNLGFSSLPICQGVSGVLVLGVTVVRHGIRVRGLEIAAMYRRSVAFGVTSIAPSLLLLDVTVVAWCATHTEAAYFALASRLTAPLSLVATALATSILPAAETLRGRLSRRPAKSLVILLMLNFIGLGIVLVTARLWVVALFGSEYVGSVVAVQFYVANAAVIVFTRSLSALLQGWRDERLVSTAVAIQSATALAAIGCGALVGGASLAAAGVFATNMVLALVLYKRIQTQLATR